MPHQLGNYFEAQEKWLGVYGVGKNSVSIPASADTGIRSRDSQPIMRL